VRTIHVGKKDRTISYRRRYLLTNKSDINTLKDDPNYETYLINKIKYSIDHIYPRVAFIDNNLDKEYNSKIVKQICNLRENLRIIPMNENKSKSGKYNQEEFMNWFNNKIKEYETCSL
jgi:hypothetical protein